MDEQKQKQQVLEGSHPGLVLFIDIEKETDIVEID